MTSTGKMFATVLQIGADDWIQMHEVAGVVEWALSTSDMALIRNVSCDLTYRLAHTGLVEIGDYTSISDGQFGFVPWNQPLSEELARIDRRWDYAVAHADPASRPGLPTFQHDVCWLNATADGWELGWISALNGYRGGIPSAELREEIADIRAGSRHGPKTVGIGSWVLAAAAAAAHLSGGCSSGQLAAFSQSAVEFAGFGSAEALADETVHRFQVLGMVDIDKDDRMSAIRLNASGHDFAAQLLADQEDSPPE